MEWCEAENDSASEFRAGLHSPARPIESMGDWAALCADRSARGWICFSITKVARALISGEVADGGEVQFIVKDDTLVMKE